MLRLISTLFMLQNQFPREDKHGANAKKAGTPKQIGGKATQEPVPSISPGASRMKHGEHRQIDSDG